MAFPSGSRFVDTNIEDPHAPSRSTPMSWATHHQSSISTLSYPQSTFNTSFHTVSPTPANYHSGLSSILHNYSESSGGQHSFVSHHKSFLALQKSVFSVGNHSQSTIFTIPKEFRPASPSSIGDKADQTATLLPSTPTYRASAPGLTTDSSPSPSPVGGATPLRDALYDPFTEPHGDSQPPATMTPPVPTVPTGIAVTSLPSPQADRVVTTSRSHSSSFAAKGKKVILGFGSSPRKRPKISPPYHVAHLTHVDFNPITLEFTGLPEKWRQFLQDTDISKSDQEENPLAVLEVVEFYQGGDNVGDKIGPIPSGSSRSPHISGGAKLTHDRMSKSFDDNLLRPVGMFLCRHRCGS